MPFTKMGEQAIVSDGEIISAVPDGEDFDKWEACIVCTKPELVRETHTKAFRIVRLGVRKARYGIGREVN